jgi:hypothetical protein
MLCAVISTAWLGGFGPALLAIILALCAFHYNLVSQSNSFGWRHDFLHVALWKCRVCYCLPFNLFVASVIAAHRKATEVIRSSHDDECVSATGRAAQPASSSDLSACSCSSRSTLPDDVSREEGGQKGAALRRRAASEGLERERNVAHTGILCISHDLKSQFPAHL